MRLLVLSTSFPTEKYPASGIFIQRMLLNLPRDVKATIISPASDQKHGLFALSNEIQHRQFRYTLQGWECIAQRPGGISGAISDKSWTLAFVPLIGAAMLWYALKYAHKVDLIHAHWSFSGIIAGAVGRLFDLPSITTLRGSDVRWASGNSIFKILIKWCVKLNSQVVTVGEDLADSIRQLLLDDKIRITVIPNGVGESFLTIPRSFQSLNYITVIGNLIALKQVDVVIRAFKSLIDLDDRLRLLIIGAGPEMNNLRDLANCLSVGDRIVFAGQLLPKEIAVRLSQSKLLVLASKSEGRPNVILEAMAAGVPVVASDIGGVQELIGNNERGLLFPVGDISQLAEHIKRIVTDPDLGKCLAGRASQWLRAQDLTWERTAQQYAKLYEQVVDEYHRCNGKRSCAG